MLPYSVSASSVNAAFSAVIKDSELLSCVPYLYTQKCMILAHSLFFLVIAI